MQLCFDDVTVAERWEIIAGRPGFRAVLAAERVFAGFKALKSRGTVCEIFNADLIKVVAPDGHRQILGPIVIATLVDDLLVDLVAIELIDPRAHDRHQRAFIQSRAGFFKPRLREGREDTSKTNAVAFRAVCIERELDAMRVQNLDVRDKRTKGCAETGQALLHKEVEGELQILGAPAFAIWECHIIAQVKDDPA